VSFNAIPTNAGTGGNEEVGKEGNIKGDTDKKSDVGTVLGTTLAGAGIGSAIGSAAGNVGRGAGIGLGAGAAAGLMAILLSRGPELEIPRGSTLDIQINRPLYLETAQINFTDPGRASALSGPPNRQPQRTTRFPF
jgi:type IV secretion system protein VirB10